MGTERASVGNFEGKQNAVRGNYIGVIVCDAFLFVMGSFRLVGNQNFISLAEQNSYSGDMVNERIYAVFSGADSG